MSVLRLHEVLENKFIFLFGKKGCGKSTTGNRFIESTTGNRPRFGNNRENLEIVFVNVYRTAVIDSPGILDEADRTIFHRAFIRSIESPVFEENLRFKLPFIFCMVVKFEENNMPNFLDVAQNFVRLFGRSGTFSLMILFIERDGILGDKDFRQAVENSDGYQYLMRVKRGEEHHRILKNEETNRIPYCRWDNLSNAIADQQGQMTELRAAINGVDRPFSRLDFAIELIRNELYYLNQFPLLQPQPLPQVQPQPFQLPRNLPRANNNNTNYFIILTILFYLVIFIAILFGNFQKS